MYVNKVFFGGKEGKDFDEVQICQNAEVFLQKWSDVNGMVILNAIKGTSIIQQHELQVRLYTREKSQAILIDYFLAKRSILIKFAAIACDRQR